MVALRDIILSLPIESNGAHRIGILVIGPPFLIVYVNENARRIIRRVGAPSGQRGLPGAIMRFCRDARDMLEDLVAAAFNDAVRKAEATTQEKMAGVSAGLPLPPGFKLPF